MAGAGTRVEGPRPHLLDEGTFCVHLDTTELLFRDFLDEGGGSLFFIFKRSLYMHCGGSLVEDPPASVGDTG